MNKLKRLIIFNLKKIHLFKKSKFKFYLITILLSNLSCNKQEYSFEKIKMDTLLQITVSTNKDYKEVRKTIDELFLKIDEYEKIFNYYEENSELAKINKKIKESSSYLKIEPSYHLLNVIKKSNEVFNLTDGRFDIAHKKISNIWKEKLKDKMIPSDNELRDLLKDKEKIIIKDNYILVKKGEILDLGGIAKGYILEELSKELEKKGISNYIINAGGDLVLSGSKSNKYWNIAVSNNKKTFGKCSYKGSKIFIVSSGSYYRYTELNGIKYSHIIDPKTASPSVSDIENITVIGKSGAEVDALATALYVMGSREAIEKAKTFKNLGLIIIKNDATFFLNPLASKYCNIL